MPRTEVLQAGPPGPDPASADPSGASVRGSRWPPRYTLRRRAVARFSCSLQRLADVEDSPYRIGFAVADGPPGERLHPPPRPIPDPHDGLPIRHP